MRMGRLRPCPARAAGGSSSSWPRREARTIFETDPSLGPATLQDAWDAWEVCHAIDDPDQKSECYRVFAVDGERVEQYLHWVQQTERLFDEEPGLPEEDTTRFGPDDWA